MKNFIYKFRYLLLVLFCTLIFLFINNSNVQAYTYGGYEFPDFPEDFSNKDYSKIICYFPNQDKYRLYIYDTGGVCHYIPSYGNIILRQKTFVDKYDFVKDGTEWTFMEHDTGVCNLGYISGYCDDSEINRKVLVYSSVNIRYGSEDSDEYFFYKTPLMTTTTMQYFVGVNLCQQVPLLIPVGLIILSMVLVIYLVRLVISRVI